MHSVLDVEHPLVLGQLRDIDAQLKNAEESLNWNSQGLDIYSNYVCVLSCLLKEKLGHKNNPFCRRSQYFSHTL